MRCGLRVFVLVAIVLAAGSGAQVEVHAADRAIAGHPAAADRCTEPADPIELTSVDQVRSLLVGTWIRCAGPAFPGALVDDVGIEVLPDGRFYRVYELADGSLARATGPEQEGEVGIRPDTYHLDWNFRVDGYAETTPAWFGSPPTMRLVMGDFVTYYHRWNGVAPRLGEPPVTVGDCPPLGELGGDTTLVGTWIRCAGEPFAGALVDDVGIEVTADGHFYRVFELPDGSLARATGANQEGTYDWVGQLNWHLLGSGYILTNPEFFSNPAMMRLDSGDEPMYLVRWDGAPPATDQPAAGTGACGALADPIEPTSIEHVEELVTGVWIRCAGVSFLGMEAGEVGIEIASDGRWFLLYEAADGSLIRTEGVDHEGMWSVQGYPGNYEFDVGVLGRGGEGSHPVFFASPSRSMRLLTMIGDADYQIWPGDPPVTGAPPGRGSDCGVITDQVTPTSAEQAVGLLVGSWTLCGGFPPGEPATWTSMLGPRIEGEVGLEMTADGGYYRLVRQPGGAVARAQGTGMEGRWTAWLNDLGTIQVDIEILGVGTGGFMPKFFGSPTAIRIDGGQSVADYVRTAPSTPPSIPRTGADTTTTMLTWAIMILLSGAALVSVASRNRRERRAQNPTI